MIRVRHFLTVVVTGTLLGWLFLVPAYAISFTTGYTAGGSWRTVYAQGFKASVTPNPDPGHAMTDTVFLDRFQFFKSGLADTAANFQLAIVDNYFLNLDTFTTSSSQLIGLSTNTITSTASIATGGAITFNFNHLPLVYGANNQDELLNNNYAAIFVNNNGGALTPVKVSTLGVNYNGNEIASDYGLPGDYFLAVTDYFEPGNDGTGNYFKTFNQTPAGGYADANFVATFDLPAGVLGDYNGDQSVNLADYIVWRDNPSILINEGASPNVVDEEDYNYWRAHFGDGSPGTSATLGATSTVPEPSAIALAVLAGFALLRVRRRSPK